MNEERKKIFEKIKKCMALSASSNEHEAEAAGQNAELNRGVNGAAAPLALE